MSSKAEDALSKELEQCKAGTHPRQRAEEKRLAALNVVHMKAAEKLRQFRVEAIDATFEVLKAEAEEVYNNEKATLQDRLAQDIVERQRRSSKVEAPELRAVTRKMRAQRGDAAPGVGAKGGKRDVKGATTAVPLRQGEVEEDFEAMAALASNYAPSLEIDLELEVQPNKRQRPVESVRPTRPVGEASGKRQRRGDFDFKGKPRAEISSARITVWYEEEHGGRKMDVPYVGVVNSCDPREGLYVKFEGFPEEMLITNEDDWRWGAHSRKPPERAR